MESTNIHVHQKARKLRKLLNKILTERSSFNSIYDFLKAYAELLHTDYMAKGNCFEIDFSNWHPKFISHSPEEIRSKSPEFIEFKIAVTKAHGFQNIEKLKESNLKFNHPFENAVDHLLTGELVKLKNILEKYPAVKNAKSNFGHRASLIHYVAANGVESYRQVCPYNIVDGLQLLLDLGCDPEAKNNIYGGSNLIGLIKTSAHPAKVGVTDRLVNLLN